MSVVTLAERMPRMTRDEERKRRGEALAKALEDGRANGLTQNKLVKYARLSAPTWQAAVKGAASEESYDLFERAVAAWRESPGDFDDDLRGEVPERSIAPHDSDDADLVIRGMKVRDRSAEEIRIPSNSATKPGEIARILAEVFGTDQSGE